MANIQSNMEESMSGANDGEFYFQSMDLEDVVKVWRRLWLE